MSNKQKKQDLDKKKASQKAEDFDIWTKGPASPSKLTKRYRPNVDPTAPRVSGKYFDEDLLPEYTEKELQDRNLKMMQRSTGDPFEELGVPAADKMTFFLLKWVFNAIKRDSAEDDPKF